MLRLAIQGPLGKGDVVEESQLRVSSATTAEDEYVEFWPAGTLAKGQFSCTACGNRVTVHQVLPRCMVCGERLWERADWSPFARSEAPRRGPDGTDRAIIGLLPRDLAVRYAARRWTTAPLRLPAVSSTPIARKQ